jgi:hypothetical protein
MASGQLRFGSLSKCAPGHDPTVWWIGGAGWRTLGYNSAMQNVRLHSGRALLEAALISLFMLTLFYYWFGVADRYAIFLYGHIATGIPLTEPFDALTSTRYWMAGLLAAGITLVFYTAVNWVGGRLAARRGASFGTPPWWWVWALCALPLAVGIPAITMTVNAPTLPLSLAAACAAAALAGLAVALIARSVGGRATRRPDLAGARRCGTCDHSAAPESHRTAGTWSVHFPRGGLVHCHRRCGRRRGLAGVDECPAAGGATRNRPGRRPSSWPAWD